MKKYCNSLQTLGFAHIGQIYRESNLSSKGVIWNRLINYQMSLCYIDYERHIWINNSGLHYERDIFTRDIIVQRHFYPRHFDRDILNATFLRRHF